MSQPPAKMPLSEADFDAIAEAVQETERGRWFLSEYAHRNRHADTEQVLEAIHKLQSSLSGKAEASYEDGIRLTIADMADAISKTKAEINAIKPGEDSSGKIGDATVELDAIVSTTEQATSEILAAAENVQEIAWTLREQGTDAEVCDKLDELMTQTYTACSFQDLTGQRIRKIVNVLNFLEARVEAMNLIWGQHDAPAAPETPEAMSQEASLLNGPALPGQGLQQFDVDGLMRPSQIPNIASVLAEEVAELADDITWEDKPSERISALETVEAAAAEAGEDVAPLAPAVPAPSDSDLKAAARTTEAIERMTESERLALFS